MGGKFTAGPWEAQESPRDDMEAMEILSETRDEIAIVELDSVDQDSLDETMANARLISASPRLYEACVAVLARLDYLRGLWGDEGISRGLADQIRGAVVQANGPVPPVSGGAPAPEADDFPRAMSRAEQSDAVKELIATWRREVHGS